MFEIIDNYNNSLNLEEFNKFVSFVCKKLKLDNCYFNIIFVDDEYIRKINKEYRGIDKSTDVISFALEDSKDLIETNERMLGDIYISYDKAKEQADYFNHTTNDEIIFLITHGILHLLGFDHMNETDEKIMFDKQDEIILAYHKN